MVLNFKRLYNHGDVGEEFSSFIVDGVLIVTHQLHAHAGKHDRPCFPSCASNAGNY